MEIRSQPGVGSDGAGDISNKMMKSQTAALGFRVKPGWAAVVLLKGRVVSAAVCDAQRIELITGAGKFESPVSMIALSSQVLRQRR